MNLSARRIALVLMALLILAVPPIEGNSSGKHTQANQGCTCHSNGGGVSATHNFPTTYMAGMMYTINIGHTGGTQAFTGGFNVMVDKGNLMNAGNGVNIDSTMRSATHTSQGQLGWSFDWMAPVGGSGAATVNVAVLQSDASGNYNGDAWDRVTVTIPEGGPPNDAPVASNVQVAPSPSPLTSEDLTLSYDYTDNDGDPESTQTEIHWYVDGTHNSAYDGQTTVQASSTQAGQKWKVEVAPHDGLDYGSPVMSNEVAIQDIDSDGDGVLDGQDAFPNDGSETTDTDGDGVGDNADAFPNDGSETLDTDGDGVGDNADAFPTNASETADTDGDNVGDNADQFPFDGTQTADRDGDGYGDNPSGTNADAFPDDETEWVDTDGDGVGDNGDAFPEDASETQDTDGDDVGDNADAFPEDATQTTDQDGDGYGDNPDGTSPDAFPEDGTEWVDTDGDGYGDNGDAFASDASQWADTDGDGYGDNPQGTTPDRFITEATQWADADNDGYGTTPTGPMPTSSPTTARNGLTTTAMA